MYIWKNKKTRDKLNKPSKPTKSDEPLQKNYEFTNLAIEDGCSNIFAIGGVLQELEQRNILQNIKKYSGTGTGAIIVVCLCMGYNAHEISNLLTNTKFSNFLDDSWGVGLDIHRIAKKYGFYKGDAFLKFIKKIIKKKAKNYNKTENMTFYELYMINGKELIIPITNVSTDKLVLLSYKNSPDMQIADAVRTSFSIPFIFKPTISYNKYDKYEKYEYLCSGSILCNYPRHVFNDDIHTLGIRFQHTKPVAYRQINNLISYASIIYANLIRRAENPDDKSIIIYTDPHQLLFDFNITPEKKKHQQMQAMLDAVMQLNFYDTNGTFST